MIQNIEFTGDGLTLLAGVSQLIIYNNDYYVKLAIPSMILKSFSGVASDDTTCIFPTSEKELIYVTIKITERNYVELLQNGVKNK